VGVPRRFAGVVALGHCGVCALLPQATSTEVRNG